MFFTITKSTIQYRFQRYFENNQKKYQKKCCYLKYNVKFDSP